MATLQDTAISALEGLINGYLRLDPEVQQRLGRLHGKVICFEIEGLGATLYFVPATDRLQLHGQMEAEPDCTIRGSLIALASLGFNDEKSDQLFGGRVEIAGDASLAHRFGQILGAMDIDWEEQLSRLVGDVPAHQAGRLARGVGNWVGRSRRTLEMDIGEYLQEEARLAPRPEEIAEFSGGIERLRDDIERLEARINRLHGQLDQDS